jgi:LmbE family N-acetylglucosaminyl deacetylase
MMTFDLGTQGRMADASRATAPGRMTRDLLGAGRVLVIAPHPDDEVLGAGGTIARLNDAGAEVVIAIVTKGAPPLYAEAAAENVRREARAAHAQLGVTRTVFLDHPAARLDQVPHHELNRTLGELVRDVAPEILLLPFVGDIHLDHQLTFLSAMVTARPHGAAFPGRILCYETLSETNWNAPLMSPSFVPNVFVDIAAQLQRKLEAMRHYGSQQRAFPHERSLEAVRALAICAAAPCIARQLRPSCWYVR